MGFNDFLTKIFGNKSQKDMREIKPWIDKIKAASPEIEQLDLNPTTEINTIPVDTNNPNNM